MDKIIFTAILVIFPFGQLIKWQFINLFDVLICLLAIITIFKRPIYPKWFSYFITFMLFCIFGLVVNNSLFTVHGSLYLLRLLAYSYVAVYVANFVKSEFVHQSLITISLTSAFFGWLQYLFLPDMRFLYNFGWDDHLYRMVGTFFDPAFLALILLLGIIIAVYKKQTKVFFFLLISLAFTYSRATYIALLLFLFYQKKYLAIFLFITILFVLPKPSGEGVNLLRTTSGFNKIKNYQETINIIKKSPVVGIGFNNICLVKENYNFNSHSCSGSDNSILFILATTGVIGLILLAYSVQRIAYSLTHSTYYILLSTSFLVVILHSMFTNSLFYPHIMFWLFSLVGLRGVIYRKRNNRGISS